MADKGSGPDSPLHDDEVKKRLKGELQANRGIRVEEEHEAEPAGEDQPAVQRSPEGTLEGGTPPGMSGGDVELRSELARHLEPSIYPADRTTVLDSLRSNNAPDSILARAENLPGGQQFGNVQDIARALGLGTEERRT
ncbi:DUF2795 domain-containing protein [Streptomyces sclerotialus]|uniref:DUF2795 domain-containing protein n=1 Tax=Streptomyces sclerotialus TaxID=1957 RepID=UPI0004C49CFD